MRNCGECRHWGSMHHDEKSGEYVAPCLVNPPAFVFGVERGVWPITETYDRCGSWQAIEALVPPDPHTPAGGWPADHTGAPGCLCTECIPF